MTREEFRSDYMEALRYIMKGEEDAASHKISAVKHGMQTLEENDLASMSIGSIVRDLNEIGIDNLSGDFKSHSRSPWIRDAGLLAVMRRHVEKLGTADDRADMLALERRTAEYLPRNAVPRVVNG